MEIKKIVCIYHRAVHVFSVINSFIHPSFHSSILSPSFLPSIHLSITHPFIHPPVWLTPHHASRSPSQSKLQNFLLSRYNISYVPSQISTFSSHLAWSETYFTYFLVTISPTWMGAHFYLFRSLLRMAGDTVGTQNICCQVQSSLSIPFILWVPAVCQALSWAQSMRGMDEFDWLPQWWTWPWHPWRRWGGLSRQGHLNETWRLSQR